MTKQNLLSLCHYYRGEVKCPFDSEKERPQGLFWMFEELFVRHSNVATSLQSKENIKRVKQRLSSEEMKQLIIDICNNWISLEELAERINRNATYLRNHIIPPLIKDKSIEMLYPGTPNHPNQKYKVPD